MDKKTIFFIVLIIIFLYYFFKPKTTDPNGMENKATVYKKLGQEFGLSPAHIAAVAAVESNGEGYLPDGRPKILFERHVFKQQLEKYGINPDIYTNQYGDLINSSGGGYGQGGANQHARLARAKEVCRKAGLREEAALDAASWGTFQIMGFSAERAGYPDATAMVKDLSNTKTPIYTNTKAMLNFCKSKIIDGKNLIEWLKENNWAKFAKGYNGAGYARNSYDKKLEAAYNKYKNS